MTERLCEKHNVPLIHRTRANSGGRSKGGRTWVAGEGAGWYCRPCANEKAAAYKEREPERVLDSKLWCFYRIRLADYRKMLEKQGNKCASCGVAADLLSERYPMYSRGFMGGGLVIDHDHACCPSSNGTRKQRCCGKCIRGLICQGCNIAAGMADDSPERLEQIATYLRTYRTNRGDHARSMDRT